MADATDVTLSITFSANQYSRYKASYKSIFNMNTDPTDDELCIQLKREAAAITCAVENNNRPASEDWSF